MSLPANQLHKISFACCLLLANLCFAQKPKPFSINAQFAVYADSIVQQHRYVATAWFGKEIQTNYQSPANQYKSADISFKFSINGKDNEMQANTDHHFTCTATDGFCETPLIKWGTETKAI